MTGSPMRVLFVNENLGGHATVHLNLARALEERTEVDPTYYDVPAPRLLRRLAGAAVPVLARNDLDLQPLRFQLAQSLVVRRRLPELVADVDAVHLYTHNAGLLSTRLLRERPSVVSLDATNTQNAYGLPYRAPAWATPHALRPTVALERRVYAAADRVVTHSAWAAESVRTYGVDDDRIRVIPFGIEVHDRPAVLPGDRPRITFVGATMARKGGWRLLEVFRRHLAGLARLTLVTRDAVAPEPGVEVFDDIVPGDPRLREILADTTVFVFPTEIDAFGYAPIEAMAMGAPVVASDIAALPEIVAHGETGLLVPTGDDVALLAAVRELLDDPNQAARMGAAGRARVLERFDARVTTAQLVDVLREVTR